MCVQNIKSTMSTERTKGFCHVVVSSNMRDGFSHLIQSAGLGGMKHNSVLMSWPGSWKQGVDHACLTNFVGGSPFLHCRVRWHVSERLWGPGTRILVQFVLQRQCGRPQPRTRLSW